MGSPVTAAHTELKFIREDPEKYADDNDSETESYYDSDGSANSEDEEDKKKESKESVKDLLERLLTDIAEGKLDLTQSNQLEHFQNHLGRRLAKTSKDPKQPTALHILAATDKKGLPDNEKLEPLITFLVRQEENLLAERDRAGHTPLYLAISEKNDKMVRCMCLAHKNIDSILSISSYEEKNCLHLAIEQRAKFADFLIAHAGADALSAKDKEGNTPLHLAVEYKRCKKEQLPIIEAIIAKCDGVMHKSIDGDYNNASLSPYRHHLESCEKNEKERKRKGEKKMKGKESQERERDGVGRAHLDSDHAIPRDIGESRIRPVSYKVPPAPLAPGNDNYRDEKRMRRITQVEMPLRKDAMVSKESGSGKYAAEMMRANITNSPSLGPDTDFPERPSEKKSMRKRDFLKQKFDAKESSKDGQLSKVTEDTIRPIRHFLKLHYLRERGHDAALEILYGRNTTSDQQIYFDLSGYAENKIRIEKMLSFLNFEEILQYVEIPKLSIEEGNVANSKKTRGRVSRVNGDGRTDLVYVFNGLRKKKVKTILKVIVDDLAQPPDFAHSDAAIEEALDKMGVEIWDWKKTDLCSEVIQKVAPNVREVHLYWSGNNAVLRGWSEEGGLKRLKELKRVHLHVQQGLDTRTRTSQNVAEFHVRMQKLYPSVIVTDEGPELLRELNDNNLTRNDTDHQDHPPKHEWVQCMKDFKQLLFDAETYQQNEGLKVESNIDEPIQVALIDDGINVNKLEFSPTGGRSFCTRDGAQNLNFPYYGSSSGHGTVMANQIYRICPRTQLYVLKLEDHGSESSTRQITARSAAQAIRAAVRKKVHIISMSWTIDPPEDEQEKRELESAILEAANEDILMFCSARDKGAKQTTSYPSKATNKIFTIGAAEASGAPDPWVGNLTHIDFTFPGNQVESEGTGDAMIKEVTSGSSVATALAAGLAALILYCVQVRILRTIGPEKEKARRDFQALKKHDQMMKAFKNIGTTEESKNKYIAVWDVFGKQVAASEKCERHRWIDLIAETGTTLCMRM